MSPGIGCGMFIEGFIHEVSHYESVIEQAAFFLYGTRYTALFKIVNDNFLHERLDEFFYELHVLRVRLVGLLGFFAGENKIQRHLIGLLHDRPLARRHFAGVQPRDARNRFQKPVGRIDQIIGGCGIFRVGPENNYV